MTEHRLARLALLLTVAMAGSALAIVRAQTPSPAALYQEALYVQETKGDLTKAIELYRAIVDKYATDAAIAPKALFEMAGCYEKLGKTTEASATYQRIVTNYASSAVATGARARMGAPQKPGQLSLRLAGGDIGDRIAPNGKFFTMIDWDTDGVATRDVATGKMHLLTPDADLDGSGDYAEGTMPSPDCKLVAYSWWNEKASRYELRVIARDGGDPRVLQTLGDKGFVGVIGWTPDSREVIAYVDAPPAQVRPGDIKAFAVSGGASRELAHFSSQENGNFTVSPDGRWLAFDRNTGTKALSDMFVMSTSGGPEIPLPSNPANDFVLDWLPDGNGLLFVSDRGNGAFGIWAMSLVNGHAAGDAVPLRPDIGRVFSLGVTTAGEFYFETRIRSDSVQIATLDPGTGKATAKPKPIEGRYLSGQMQAAWSVDGTRLAYVQSTTPDTSRANPLNNNGPSLGKRLAIHNIVTGDVKLINTGLQNLQNPAWMPDGHSVLVQGNSVDAHQGLYRIDADGDTGVATPVSVRPDGSQDGNRNSPQVSLDRKFVFFKHTATLNPGPRPNANGGGIWIRDLSSGTERVVVEDPINMFVLSPDGRQIAFSSGAASGRPVLMLVSAEGGAPRPVATAGQAARPRAQIAWSADGRSVYQVREGAHDLELWQVPIDGSEPHFTGITGNINRISANPDGRRLAISVTQQVTETWAMKALPTFNKK